MAVVIDEYYASGPCIHCGIFVRRVKVPGGWGTAMVFGVEARPCKRRGGGQGHELTVIPVGDNDQLEEWLDE